MANEPIVASTTTEPTPTTGIAGTTGTTTTGTSTTTGTTPATGTTATTGTTTGTTTTTGTGTTTETTPATGTTSTTVTTPVWTNGLHKDKIMQVASWLAYQKFEENALLMNDVASGDVYVRDALARIYDLNTLPPASAAYTNYSHLSLSSSTTTTTTTTTVENGNTSDSVNGTTPSTSTTPITGTTSTTTTTTSHSDGSFILNPIATDDGDLIRLFMDRESIFYNWKLKDVRDLNQSNGFVGITLETASDNAIVAFRGTEGGGGMQQLKYDLVQADLVLACSRKLRSKGLHGNIWSILQIRICSNTEHFRFVDTLSVEILRIMRFLLHRRHFRIKLPIAIA